MKDPLYYLFTHSEVTGVCHCVFTFTLCCHLLVNLNFSLVSGLPALYRKDKWPTKGEYGKGQESRNYGHISWNNVWTAIWIHHSLCEKASSSKYILSHSSNTQFIYKLNKWKLITPDQPWQLPPPAFLYSWNPGSPEWETANRWHWSTCEWYLIFLSYFIPRDHATN